MDKIIGTIKAISVKKKEEGEIGFLLVENPDKWYNVKAPADYLDIMLKDIIQKGNFIEFEYDGFLAKNFVLKEKGKSVPQKSGKENWADEMTNFEDLMNAAHEKAKKDGKLLSITTQVLLDGAGNPLIDYTNKRALFKAIIAVEDVKTQWSELYTGYGDAEGISNELIKPHFIRMAETRAICRALRWYTNNAAVSEEECSGAVNNTKPEVKSLKNDLINLMKSKPEESFAFESIPGLIKATDKETNSLIQDLLEEGIVYEPHPGYIKYLG